MKVGGREERGSGNEGWRKRRREERWEEGKRKEEVGINVDGMNTHNNEGPSGRWANLQLGVRNSPNIVKLWGYDIFGGLLNFTLS